MRSGATVKGMDTDAEGRPPLADATDACDPEMIVDLASGTGGCIHVSEWIVPGPMSIEADAAAGRLCILQRVRGQRANVGVCFRCLTPARSTWRATSLISRTWMDEVGLERSWSTPRATCPDRTSTVPGRRFERPQSRTARAVALG